MASHTSESTTPKLGAPKDKNCPYCGQAFTSSSLGRHLDLYIKEKNPRAPDGIHDVEAIRKLRGEITRRQPRGSISSRKEDGTPARTPRRAPQTSEPTPAADSEAPSTPSIPKDGTYAVDSTLSKFPFLPRWEATGVINDIPSKATWAAEPSLEATRRPPQRAVSKQTMQKAQFDAKQKLADAMDTARAAELALREILGSWRSAKQQIDNSSMPFDFDPLALDFPALTLQCLQPPPTLFSSTQHATSTSWSVQYPGKREFGALQAFFQEEFSNWKIKCASATTVAMEELTYPPSSNPGRDTKEAIRRAEKSAEALEKQVEEHLVSAYSVWDSLPAPRRHELWVLELARGVGRKHKETESLKELQYRLKQENTHLKMQVDQLNRLQQPREFKLLPPSAIPIDKDVVRNAYEQGVRGAKTVGFSMEDRHVDIGSVVANVIERWKNVITSTRVTTTGLSGQRALGQGMQAGGDLTSPPAQQAGSTSAQNTPPVVRKDSIGTGHMGQPSNASTNDAQSENSAPSVESTAPPSMDDEMSDQDADADADMDDDDGFNLMGASPTKLSHVSQMQQHAAHLEIPRTRGQLHQQAMTPNMQFMMQGGAESPAGSSAMAMTRSMPDMGMAIQGSHMQGGDINMMQQVRGGSMYMD